MFNSKLFGLGAAAVIAALSAPLSNQANAAFFEIAVDPGFEDAGVSGLEVDPAPGALPPGWVGFSNGGSVGLVTADPFSGSYNAFMSTDGPTQNPLIKNANIGVGVVLPNSTVEISFWARGSSTDGGVAFAEFFSELAGGGTSSSEILGGGPLALDPVDWTLFEFTTTTGADVSGGVTLQFVAVTGGLSSSTSDLEIDDISVRVDVPVDVPVPATFGLLLPGLAGLLVARRRQA